MGAEEGRGVVGKQNKGQKQVAEVHGTCSQLAVSTQSTCKTSSSSHLFTASEDPIKNSLTSL